jgi:hypothetical protein
MSSDEQEVSRVKDRHAAELWRIPEVVGIGVEQEPTGEFVITVHVRDDSDETIAQLPTHIEGYPVRVEYSGPYRKF